MAFNLTGDPAIALSSGLSASGLPLGLQIASHPFHDATVYRIAAAYEAPCEALLLSALQPWRRPSPTAALSPSALLPPALFRSSPSSGTLQRPSPHLPLPSLLLFSSLFFPSPLFPSLPLPFPLSFF